MCIVGGYGCIYSTVTVSFVMSKTQLYHCNYNCNAYWYFSLSRVLSLLVVTMVQHKLNECMIFSLQFQFYSHCKFDKHKDTIAFKFGKNNLTFGFTHLKDNLTIRDVRTIPDKYTVIHAYLLHFHAMVWNAILMIMLWDFNGMLWDFNAMRNRKKGLNAMLCYAMLC